jgi:hypothetical protein
MVLTVDAAAESLASILALNRLGIAMAAMIRTTGMAAMLMYPIISPANAMPSPRSRPRLSRMLLRDRCPRIMAGIPVSNPKGNIARMPRMRLPTALPSVSCCPT